MKFLWMLLQLGAGLLGFVVLLIVALQAMDNEFTPGPKIMTILLFYVFLGVCWLTVSLVEGIRKI